jgi:hypothetical protein
MVEQWKFTVTRVTDPDCVFKMWCWSRTIDDDEVCSSMGVNTLWECVKNATQAGFDPERMGPLDFTGDVVLSQPIVVDAPPSLRQGARPTSRAT